MKKKDLEFKSIEEECKYYKSKYEKISKEYSQLKEEYLYLKQNNKQIIEKQNQLAKNNERININNNFLYNYNKQANVSYNEFSKTIASEKDSDIIQKHVNELEQEIDKSFYSEKSFELNPSFSMHSNRR